MLYEIHTKKVLPLQFNNMGYKNMFQMALKYFSIILNF